MEGLGVGKKAKFKRLLEIKKALADTPALGIAVESPQPDEGGARTWNGKRDPLWVTPKKIKIKVDRFLIFCQI